MALHFGWLGLCAIFYLTNNTLLEVVFLWMAVQFIGDNILFAIKHDLAGLTREHLCKFEIYFLAFVIKSFIKGNS